MYRTRSTSPCMRGKASRQQYVYSLSYVLVFFGMHEDIFIEIRLVHFKLD